MWSNSIDDLMFSKAGDFVCFNGDLVSCNEAGEYALVQDVRSRICGSFGDWRSHLGITANLDNFIGQPNNRETAKKMEAEIKRAIFSTSFIDKNDVYIRVFPISTESIGVYFEVKVWDVKQRKFLKINDIYALTKSSINPGLIAGN